MEIKQDIVDEIIEGSNPEDLLEDIVDEIKSHNYRITRINNIDNISERENQSVLSSPPFSYYKVVEFCNLYSCSQIISSELLAGVFMPTRFLVFQLLDEKQVHLAFLKPTAFASLFVSKKITSLAMKLEEDMISILEEIRG